MKKLFSNKRGQSLIEVVVALSILTVALAGVVTLAVNTVGLMISSRFRMEATAYAQAGLEGVKSARSNMCNWLSNGTTREGKTVEGINYTRETKIEDADSFYSGAKLVTVKVTWTEKGVPGNVELKQIMDSGL